MGVILKTIGNVIVSLSMYFPSLSDWFEWDSFMFSHQVFLQVCSHLFPFTHINVVDISNLLLQCK